ncbi:hypothetical protein OH828_27470 [Streptomyces anulatus]|uniref:hypothetical protein n=1 Tax=Streptomyces TaxID=1883 RepID=UPI0015CF420A|nr:MULTISPECIES: hypothetical protein [unclassified Streptomyces]
MIGALCILVSLIGEGLKISEVEIRRLSRARAISLAALGVLFIALPLVTGGLDS